MRGDALGDDATTLDNVGSAVTDVSADSNAADNVRVLNIDVVAPVSLNGLTVTGGMASRVGGDTLLSLACHFWREHCAPLIRSAGA